MITLNFNIPDESTCEVKSIDFFYQREVITISINGQEIGKIGYEHFHNMANLINNAYYVEKSQ